MNVACPVCYHETNKISDVLSCCPYCLHIFQTDLTISVKYDGNYLKQRYLNYTTCDVMSAVRAGFILGNVFLSTDAKILDVGYANGAFLKTVEKLGYDVYGIDLHGQDMGIREVSYTEPIVYDIVCFFDSLEHFSDLSLPQKLQTKNVAVSLPMIPPFFPTSPEKWKHYRVGEHLHYFSKQSLDFYMKRWGLTRKIAEGHPEDVVRGKLVVENKKYPNIYSAIYSR